MLSLGMVPGIVRRPMRRKYLVVMAVLAALASGCSSTPTKQEIAKDEAAAREVHVSAQAQLRHAENERMTEALSQVPAWALQPPKPDETAVYAVGMAESNKIRVALRKAMLEAEFALAKQYNQELSGSERSYTQDNNGSATTEQYTALIDKLVSQVPVVGFEVVKQEVRTIDAQYHAFILLKLPHEEFNQVLHARRMKTKDKTIIDAFNDLERRLDKRREQLREDARAESGIHAGDGARPEMREHADNPHKAAAEVGVGSRMEQYPGPAVTSTSGD